MLKLPYKLDEECFSVFLQCDEFNNDELLRAIFTTDDLAPFADSLPSKSRGSKREFVTIVKSFLLDKRLADGRVLLLPFLDTLRGHYSEQDALHGELNDLYQRVLAHASNTTSATYGHRVADSLIETPRYTGQVKLNVCRRLVGSNWQDLADYLNIPPFDRASFDRGREPQGVWEWLESRKRLAELPQALVAIGRGDLLEILPHPPR